MNDNIEMRVSMLTTAAMFPAWRQCAIIHQSLSIFYLAEMHFQKVQDVKCRAI